jgi:ribosomal protein S18 acetylase RimI-like enzyme
VLPPPEKVAESVPARGARPTTFVVSVSSIRVPGATLGRVRVAVESRVLIRRAAPGDDAFLARLGQEAFGDFDRRAGETTLSIVRHSGTETLIATLEGEPVGFASLELGRGGVAHLQAIAVRAAERGRGIGQRLLLAIERAARARRATLIHLVTAQANVEAIALFLKCGFGLQRRHRRFYGRGQDACTMVKDLSG